MDKEWAWTMYVLKQWGDKRAIPTLERIYPLLDFCRRAKIKRLIDHPS